MVAIYVDDNVYYFHEELCLSEGDQMMMMVNVMMMMLMITMMVVMMMTPISGSFSEVGGILSPITWLRFKLTISNTASEQIACLFMFCPFLDYCLCCPLPNVSEKTFGQNIENLTHHQKHCHWKKSGDAQGHLMQCLCSEKRNYSFSSSKKAMILKTSLSLKAPSPQNRRACRSSSERCRWWGCTGE